MSISVPIGDLCSVFGGGTPARDVPQYYGGDIPWVTPKDMKTWQIRDAKIRITRAGLDNSAARLVPANSVLVVVRSGVLKHTIPVAVNRTPVAINQDMKAFLCSKSLNADYLARFIKARSPEILQWVRATTADNFPVEKLKNLRISLPPLSEQRRIASILDKADALRTKRLAALALLDALAQSIFFDIFGDPVTNTKGWPDSMLLGDAADVASGVTIGRSLAGKSTRAVPYLAVVNVQDRHLDLTTTKTTEASEEEIQRYRLERDDLLLTEGGDADKLGRGTLWNGELPECIHQNHVFRVRLRSNDLTPLFLNWLVGSQRGKRYFLRSAKQTTGIASINMTQLRAFPLLVPPLSVQRRFANAVGACDGIRNRQLASLAEIESLLLSIQRRAFFSELVQLSSASL